MDRIFLLEDDLSLIDGLCYALEKQGFQVTACRSVTQACQRLAQPGDFDLLILDVALPDGSGFQVCEAVRRRDAKIPILFLTAADEEMNIIRGLDSGGDDYITKPFKLGELFSRIRALLRRAGSAAPPDTLLCGDLRIDLLHSRAVLKGEALTLTGAEYRLLCLLAGSAGQVITRARLLDALWDSAGDFVDDNPLSVYVRRLREKVEEDPSHPRRLRTVRGFGYVWEATP